MKESMGNAWRPGVELPPQEQAMIERRQRLLGPAYRLFYQRPLHIVRGEGVWLYDADGQAYLDAYNNVPSVGHCHPHVVQAIATQAATLNTHTRYLHKTILDYSERLLATVPSALAHMMFTCTGSEANDLAFRIVRAHTGKSGVVVTRYAYHGVTERVARFSPCLGEGNELGPEVEVIDPPGTGPDAGANFAASVRVAAAALRARGVGFAALLVDTAFTSDGNFVDPVGFLRDAVEATHAEGGVFIADEVQPGFGRTGVRWNFARHGVVPDLVTLGKPMGNGHPIGGVMIRPEILESFAAHVRYFNTFGGNPVSCAAGMAVLDVLENEGLEQNAAEVGAWLARELRAIGSPHVGEIRAAGLCFAADLRGPDGPDPALATHVVNELRARRILVSISGIDQSTLKIRPPLCFRPEHAQRVIDAIGEILR
jgi:4-aminobutyrate aminotransferase-like enzyme